MSAPKCGSQIYGWSFYKWCRGTSSYLTKYNIREDRGIVDNKIFLDASDDVAHMNWGGVWRMPTAEGQQELY